MAKIIPVDIDTVNNPVARAEFKHQRWVIQNSRSGGVWIVLAVALVLPAILLSALYTLLVLLFPIVPNWLQSVQTFMGEFAFVVVTTAAFGILPRAPERILGAITAPIVLGLRFVLAFAAAGAMIAFVIAGVYQDNERMITITLLASALYPVLLWMALRFSQRVVD
jgi:ABC-type transport system involved in multi-copper enzyme maturation permease subunit